jgi:hypothetical protein
MIYFFYEVILGSLMTGLRAEYREKRAVWMQPNTNTVQKKERLFSSLKHPHLLWGTLTHPPGALSRRGKAVGA